MPGTQAGSSVVSSLTSTSVYVAPKLDPGLQPSMWIGFSVPTRVRGFPLFGVFLPHLKLTFLRQLLFPGTFRPLGYCARFETPLVSLITEIIVAWPVCLLQPGISKSPENLLQHFCLNSVFETNLWCSAHSVTSRTSEMAQNPRLPRC